MAGEAGEPERSGTPPDGTRGDDAFHSVVRALRFRAKGARWAAIVFLFGLIITVIAGLGFYLLLPFWENRTDARKVTLQSTQDNIKEEKLKLDKERNALIEANIEDDKQDLDLFSILSHQWVTVEIEADTIARARSGAYSDDTAATEVGDGWASGSASASSASNHVVFDDGVLIYRADGTILRSDGLSGKFDVVGDFETPEFKSHVLIGDILMIYGHSDKILRSDDRGYTFRSVQLEDEFFLKRHFIIDKYIFIYTQNRRIIRSSDAGKNFHEINWRDFMDLNSEGDISENSREFTFQIPFDRRIQLSRGPVDFYFHAIFDDYFLISDREGNFIISDYQVINFKYFINNKEMLFPSYITLEDSIILYKGSDAFPWSELQAIKFNLRNYSFESILFEEEISGDNGSAYSAYFINHFLVGETIIMYDSRGRIWRSEDSGSTFYIVYEHNGGSLIRHIVGDSFIIFYDDQGVIVRSVDDGKSFEKVDIYRVSSDQNQVLFRRFSHFVIDRVIFIYEARGAVFQSHDHGATFYELEGSIANIIYGIPDLSGTRILYGSRYTALVSDDDFNMVSEIPYSANEIVGHFLINGSLYLYDINGNISKLSDQWRTNASELIDLSGDDGDAKLAQFLDADLPAHIRNWSPIQELRAELEEIKIHRRALTLQEQIISQDIKELAEFPYGHLEKLPGTSKNYRFPAHWVRIARSDG